MTKMTLVPVSNNNKLLLKLCTTAIVKKARSRSDLENGRWKLEEGEDGRDAIGGWNRQAGQADAEATTGASALPAQVGLVGSGGGSGTARDVATRRKWAAPWHRAPWVSLLVSTKGSNSIVVLRLPHSPDPSPYGYHE